MYLKKLLTLIVFISFSALSAYSDEEIKAQNNAYRHNNKGLIYLQDKYYFGAIKEFQIAIDLSPNTQASSVYYINLGKTYEEIGYSNLAMPYFEKALSLNPLNFNNYLKLVENYKKQGIVDSKIIEYQKKTNSPLNDVIIGLLYIQKGHITTGITMLDDFCNKEPDLLITSGIKAYIDRLVKEKLE